MTIFTNINDNKLYTVEHMIVDLRFANCGEFCGIYAYPYNWKGNTIHLKSKDINECAEFVVNNFNPVTSI